jgi:hypothetical protein
VAVSEQIGCEDVISTEFGSERREVAPVVSDTMQAHDPRRGWITPFVERELAQRCLSSPAE